MAAHLPKKVLKKVPVTPYLPMARAKIRSGDLLFTSGSYTISKWIQGFTKSPWSHVGVILKASQLGRLLLLESVEDMGVRFAPLSKYLFDYEKGRPYKGIVCVARMSKVNKKMVGDIARFGIDELTQPYDKGEILKIVGRILAGKGKHKKDREYICSELVEACFRKAKYKFKFNKKGYISPEDIWLDPNVSLRFRVL